MSGDRNERKGKMSKTKWVFSTLFCVAFVVASLTLTNMPLDVMAWTVAAWWLGVFMSCLDG